jgi:hypothetical protein
MFFGIIQFILPLKLSSGMFVKSNACSIKELECHGFMALHSCFGDLLLYVL